VHSSGSAIPGAWGLRSTAFEERPIAMGLEAKGVRRKAKKRGAGPREIGFASVE